jgi:hypothetical protein
MNDIYVILLVIMSPEYFEYDCETILQWWVLHVFNENKF